MKIWGAGQLGTKGATLRHRPRGHWEEVGGWLSWWVVTEDGVGARPTPEAQGGGSGVGPRAQRPSQRESVPLAVRRHPGLALPSSVLPFRSVLLAPQGARKC